MRCNRKFKALITVLILLVSVFNIVSCQKRPKTVITETDTYYSYNNVSYGTHERHYLDLVIPKDDNTPSGIILYIHGGGWIAGDKEAYESTLISNAERGYISAAINYRYADGKHVTCGDILDDIDDALFKIKALCSDRGINVDRVMLTGGSAGGHISLMYAYTRVKSAPLTPVAVVSYAGPTDLCDSNFYITKYSEDIKKMISKISGANLLKKTLEECKNELIKASPINYVGENTVPTILCHGTLDDVVPYSNAESLYKLLCQYEVDCELITFKNSGHGLEADSDSSVYSDSRFYKFAEKYLR